MNPARTINFGAAVQPRETEDFDCLIVRNAKFRLFRRRRLALAALA
jgi:hypothetical protein